MTYKKRQSCIYTIQTLRRLALNIHGVIDVVDDMNCNELIRLLQTEPCEDAISRQAVLDIIHHYKNDRDSQLSDLTDGVCNLPPVQPAVCIAKISFDDQQMKEMVNKAISNWEPSVQTEQNAYKEGYDAHKRMIAREAKFNHYCPRCMGRLESCEDVISRQAVLSEIETVCFSKEWIKFRADYGSNGERDYIINYIKQLPSVYPEQKIGKWNKIIDKSSIRLEVWHYECSNCGNYISGYGKYKYCPSCGAKMEEDAENKDIYEDYPCRKCDFATRQSCCGCPEEKEWQEKHKNERR